MTDAITPTAIASGLVSGIRDPLQSSELIRDLNKLLEPSGLFVGHRLLNANDLAVRLSVPVSVAKKCLNNHGDIQVGRKWRMTEARFAECVRGKRFKTK